ncbi:hypothetical protein C2G38_2234414 [Gigaspora rosea]|uniref:Uncharacterized protein n=1 Tax=Gigaspora rosea TaxID=44941 RepID=A0A397TQE0_9GLOM|nr:hypothetical protein C2G38_2234414 [Gigaspora rosea]
MFEEAGFDIYLSHELIEVRSQRTEAEKAIDNHCLAVNELIERIRNVYWQVKERDVSLRAAI